MAPKSIKIFQILGWILLGLSGLLLLLMIIFMSSSRYGIGGVDILILLMLLAGTACLGVGVFLAGLKRNAVGKWLFIGGAAGVALALLICLIVAGAYSGGAMVVYLLFLLGTLGLAIPSIIFLFQPDANGWFAQGPIRSAGHAGGYGAQGSYGAGAPYNPQPAVPQQGYDPSPAPAAADTSFAPAPTAAEPMPAADGAMRTCPYCAEQIRAQASKCRFCGSEVTPVA